MAASKLNNLMMALKALVRCGAYVIALLLLAVNAYAGARSGFDPLFPFMLLMAGGYLISRRTNVSLLLPGLVHRVFAMTWRLTRP